jgi:LmbE family N-acetylglucosaminyl deacetylase
LKKISRFASKNWKRYSHLTPSQGISKDGDGHTKPKEVAVMVAHPDDETLWAGGTILSQNFWRCLIVTLCRASDADRAPRFFQAAQALRAEGRMGDLDDGPEQVPLAESELQKAILQLLPQKHFDLIISHSPAGEYTRHRRHEEVGKAVITLWQKGKISADELWAFAYEDGGKQYLPRPIKTAMVYRALPETIWRKKYDIITTLYGFQEDGFEARTTPRAEAFWQFTNPLEARRWLENRIFEYESSDLI